MGEIQKHNGLSTVKRCRSGDGREDKNSLRWEAYKVIWGQAEIWPVLLLRAMSGSIAMQPQESLSMSMALAFTKGHVTVPLVPPSTLPPGATLISKGCTELAPPFTGYNTRESYPVPHCLQHSGACLHTLPRPWWQRSQPWGGESSRAGPILHLPCWEWHGWERVVLPPRPSLRMSHTSPG